MNFEFAEPPREWQRRGEVRGPGQDLAALTTAAQSVFARRHGHGEAAGPGGRRGRERRRQIHACSKSSPGKPSRPPARCTVGASIEVGYFSQNSSRSLGPRTDGLRRSPLAHSDGIGRLRAQSCWARSYSPAMKSKSNRGALRAARRAAWCSATILAAPVNFSVLDEPTNHLDINRAKCCSRPSRTSTARCMIVSHDRHFLRSLVTGYSKSITARCALTKATTTTTASRRSRPSLKKAEGSRSRTAGALRRRIFPKSAAPVARRRRASAPGGPLNSNSFALAFSRRAPGVRPLGSARIRVSGSPARSNA